MTRTPTAKCQTCTRPMWAKRGGPTPQHCRSCRSTGAFRTPRGLGLTRTQAAERARAAVDLSVSPRVCDCGEVFQGTIRRKLCDLCKDDRRRDHYRRKNRSRLGYGKAIRALPLSLLAEWYGWRCWLCEKDIDPALRDRHPMMASYDHVIPTSRGGSDEPDNLRLAHLVCNIRKGNKLITPIRSA